MILKVILCLYNLIRKGYFMFGSNLKKYRKKVHMTQKELAYRVELLTGNTCKTEYISSYERNTNPKLKTIEVLAEILNIPIQYLFNDSPAALAEIVSKELPEFKLYKENTVKVSLVSGYVGAGSGGHLDERLNVSDFLIVDNAMIKPTFQKKDVKGLKVIGDSMQPYVSDSDVILFCEIKKNSYTLSDGKYIITTINGTMVKNLTFKTNGDIIISSCNKDYERELIKCSESQEYLDIVGVVVGRILSS